MNLLQRTDSTLDLFSFDPRIEVKDEEGSQEDILDTKECDAPSSQEDNADFPPTQPYEEAED